MNKIHPLTTIGLLALLGAGCSPVTPPPDRLVPPQVVVAPAVSELTTQIISTDQKRDASGGNCQFSANYPLVTSGTSAEAMLAINTAIESLIGPPTSTLHGQERLDATAKEYLDGCATSLTDLRKAQPKSASADGWYADLSSVIRLNDGNLFEIELVSGEYSGGAHPNHGSKFLLFDAKSGKRLVLGDLVTHDKLRAFARLQAEATLKAAGDQLFPDAKAIFETALSATTTVPVEKQVELYGKQGNFYIDAKAGTLTFVYGPYEIAPYAAGDIEASLSFKAISDLLDPNGPATYLIRTSPIETPSL